MALNDITYIRLAREFGYLAVIMDVYTRAVRGWHLSRWLDRELTLTALRRALADRMPDIYHSDQGVQYACGDYTTLLREHGVQISMAAGGQLVGTPARTRIRISTGAFVSNFWGHYTLPPYCNRIDYAVDLPARASPVSS